MDPLSITTGVTALVKVCFWAGQELYDLAEKYKSANSVMASMSRECQITGTALKRTQEVLRERPEAFSRPGKTLELLDSFDTAVSGIRHIIRNLAKSVSNVNNSKDGFVKSSKFVWNESELRSLLEDMRAQRSLIDSVINSIQIEALSILHSAVTNSGRKKHHTTINVTHMNHNSKSEPYVGLLGTIIKKNQSRGHDLQNCIDNNDHFMLWHMLEDGADPETPIQYTSNSKGVCKPLHSASIGGSLKMIELLLTYKAKINSIDYYSREPLHLAVGTDRFECVKLLLENGADHSPKDELGRTPLHYAVEYGLLSMTKYLLDQGASPDGLPDIKSPYPLAVAARARQPEIAQLLVDKGATVDCRDANLSTPFIIAAWWGSLRVMRILVKHGAAFDAVDKGGDQAIAFAADGNPKYENDYINIISFLLGCGADIDHADSKGWTALHFATIEGKINTVRFLLEQGALHRLEAQAHYEVIHGEKKGSRVYGTPLNMAKMLGYTAIIKELEDFDKFKSKSM